MLHSRTLTIGLLSAACLLASCQPTPPATTTNTPAVSGSQTLNEAGARAAVFRYLQGQPNAALYVLDSARVNDNEANWQVLVPRTDWAGRMPNRARFEVNKTTGLVSTAPVK